MGQFKEFLNESLSNELMYLKRYLSMNESEKAIHRALANPYFVNDFLEKDGEEVPGDEEYEKVEWMVENDKDLAIRYGEYVYNEHDYADSSEIELFDQVDFNKIVRHKWLIHFSNDASEIARTQKFEKGTPYDDYSRLGLSTHFSKKSKTGGFNFAYDANNFEKYYKERGVLKYGKEAILFNGDGIEVWHHGDEEPQVIFDGLSTRGPLIYIENTGDSWEIKSTKTNGKLIKFERISDVIDWVVTNYHQYRKHL